MNYRKAYNLIKRDECNGMCCVPEGDPCMNNCQWVPTLKALKKQIPKPVEVKLKGTTDYNTYCYCPVCRNECGESSQYCVNCGQAIDWEGKDE